EVMGRIDWDRRHRLMRMHTCLHLLSAVVTGDVTGGQVGDGKGRLDFNLPNTQLDREQIAAGINRLVTEDHPVRSRWITDTELAAPPAALAESLGRPNLVVVDATYFLPMQGRNARAEYERKHIPGAVFFDIDAIADKASPLPHMLPDAAAFAAAVGELGIGNDSRIVV